MSIQPVNVRNIYDAASMISDQAIIEVIGIVDEISLVYLTSGNYSTTMLAAIETYLAAHFLAIGYEQGGLVRKRTGDSEERYREISLETSGLALTNFGQQALALDVEGKLSTLATKSVKAQFRII